MSSAAPLPLGLRAARPRRRARGWRLLPRMAELLAPFKAVRWTVAYAALLAYLVLITTYQLQGVGIVVICVALIGLLFEGRIRVHTLAVAFGALALWAFAGTLWSSWPGIVRQDVTNLGKVWLIVVVAASTLRDRRRLRLFMLVFLSAYALYPVRGSLFNFFGAGYTMAGRALWNFVYANPNDLAALTLLQLSICAAVYVAEPPGWWKRASLAGLVVLPILMLLTQSRGGFLGLLLFGVLAGAAQRKKLRLAGFAAIILVAATLVVPSSAWDRLGGVGTIGAGGTRALGELDDDGSAQQRYQIWQTSYRIIRDHRLTGVGWGAYPQANELYSPELGARDTHSTWLNVTAEIGFPGLALFLLMIGVAVQRAERVRRRIRSSDPIAARQLRLLVLGLAAFLTAGIFGTFTRLTFLYLQLTLIWAVAEVAMARYQQVRRDALRQARAAHAESIAQAESAA